MTAAAWFSPAYPKAHDSRHTKGYASQIYGELEVPDPYDWLECNNSDTREWIDAQATLTKQYLDNFSERQALEDDIRKSRTFPYFSSPTLEGDGRWYWLHNKGSQAHQVLYRSNNSGLPKFSLDDSPGEVFFDPNCLPVDNSLTHWAFSVCGNYFAYGLTDCGRDTFTVYIRPTSIPFDTADLTHNHGRLPDELQFVKHSSMTWTHDSKGFFYQRYPAKDFKPSHCESHAVLYYHRIGIPQSDDALVMRDDMRPDRVWDVDVTTLDGRYLILRTWEDSSTGCLLWIADLHGIAFSRHLTWHKLVDQFEARWNYVANDGTRFYFCTNYCAPRYKIVSVDLAEPAEDRHFVDVVPEDKEALLDVFEPVNENLLVLVFKRNVNDEVYLYNLNGRRITRLLPDAIGTISLKAHRGKPWFFLTLTSFTLPGTIYRYDTASECCKQMCTTFWEAKVEGLEPKDFLTEQVWYSSKDGTKIPMFLIRHKDTALDGTAPTLQWGYGGFAVSAEPEFKSPNLTFIQRYGAVLAIPNVRGGGEFGIQWHEAAIKERKVNSFDDFIAATEYLTQKGYVAADKVIIMGESNGGLLAAACINRAPEGLYSAAILDVALLDLLKFTDFTCGPAWRSEFGDPEIPHEFDNLRAISPLHNIRKDRDLPAILVLTNEHDERVPPLHSYKYVATIQATHPQNPQPLLLRVGKLSGHSSGKKIEDIIKEAADKFGFVAQSLGLVSRRIP